MNSTPRELGYRMPAEWAQQSAVWLQWPHRLPTTTVGGEDAHYSYQRKLETIWLAMSWEIHQHETVCIIANDDNHAAYITSQLNYYGYNMDSIDIHVAATYDVWHRDSGPIFVRNAEGQLAVTGWNFNGWGTYPEYVEHEQHIPAKVAEILGLPFFKAPIVSEGGALEVNGSGSVIATRSSLINDNRNPGKSQAEIETALKDYLGVTNIIWLSGAPPEVCMDELGDGTDFHIDIAARFVNQNTVVYAWTDDTSDPRYPYLKQHREELQQARDENGEPLNLVALELPRGGVYATSGRFNDYGSNHTDSSYCNYLVANNLVLVPIFGNINDQKALDTLQEFFPERKVMGIPALSINEEGGAIHCVTQQQPAAR